MGCFKALAVSLVLLVVLPVSFGAQSSTVATTPLQDAVRSNDLAAVQRLLRAGANPSEANRYGVTPLSLAAENGDTF